MSPNVRKLRRIRKGLQSEYEAASYNGSYQGQVIATEKIDLFNKVLDAVGVTLPA